jgi:hypothetical protein
MSGRYWLVLLAIVGLALILPVTAWFSAEATAVKSLKQQQLAGLERERFRQQQAQVQFEQQAQFAAVVQHFVDGAAQYGLSSRSPSAYPVRFRERVSPAEMALELAQLHGESGQAPERFYVPQSFFFGREGLDLSNRNARRLEMLPRVRQDHYILAHQGRALVVNDDR